MKIHFTPDTLEPILSQCGSDPKLKLVYDAEGCGCAVSGVPTLWQVGQTGQDDELAETNAFHLTYEPRHEVFFEEEMTIDYDPVTRAFRLKSRQQTYNGTMLILDKRS